MPLSNAEKQANRRRKLRAEGRTRVTLHLLPALHDKLRRRAAARGRTMIGELEAILRRQKD